MLFNGIEHCRLNVRVGTKFALADAADAHRALERRKTTGKVVLTACLQAEPGPPKLCS